MQVQCNYLFQGLRLIIYKFEFLWFLFLLPFFPSHICCCSSSFPTFTIKTFRRFVILKSILILKIKDWWTEMNFNLQSKYWLCNFAKSYLHCICFCPEYEISQVFRIMQHVNKHSEKEYVYKIKQQFFLG